MSDIPRNDMDEIDISFELLWPDNLDTRAYLDEYGNERFSNGDMIHILGTFQTETLNEDGSKTKGVESRYGALEFNGVNWIKKEGSDLTWPAISTSGSFTAYYISGSNGLLTGNDPTEKFPLSNLTVTTDPLIAQSKNNIPYGNAVKLEFSHICSFLTIVDLEPQVSDVYWFIRTGDLKDQNGEPVVFNNAYQIGLGNGKYGPTLEFKFLQEPSEEFKDLVYISGHRIINEPTSENPLGTTSVQYFLEPGYYNTFQLVYPSSTTEYFKYIEYKYNSAQTNGESAPIEPLLQANSQYTLNITKSKGSVTVNNPFTEGGWDESEDATIIVDVEEFLKAATSGNSYTENNTPILQSDGNGTTTLVRNIDFDNYDYSNLNGFYPNIPENVTFDGDLHYIQNLHDPLFRNNNGNIRNLGVRKVNAYIISEENDENKDNSRNGALCHLNSGNIDNIRVKDVVLNVKIKSYVEQGVDGSETHNVGGLAGSNIGNITEVAFGDKFEIRVSGYSDDSDVNASVLIGGVVGQNAARGKITDISILNSALSITINNTCEGVLGNYSSGGIVGQSSGYIMGVNLSNVTVDCSSSKGVTSYIGGMAGNLTLSGNEGSMVNCVISGKVLAGLTKKEGVITSESYIGGIAGMIYNLPVTGCRSFIDVYGVTEPQNNVIYATGGAFGRINTSNSYNFSNLIIWGGALQGATTSIGNFAGIAPSSEDWNEWYKYFGTYNISVKQFGNYNTIGSQIDSN